MTEGNTSIVGIKLTEYMILKNLADALDKYESRKMREYQFGSNVEDLYLDWEDVCLKMAEYRAYKEAAK